MNNLVAWAYTTGKVLLKSDGTSWRPIIHIEDISRAFVALLHAPKDKMHNQAFNVARKEDNYQIRQIAEIVADVVPNSQVEFSDDHFPDPRNYKVDSTKIQTWIPEFKPQWNVQKGAVELYESYKKNGITLDEFEGIKYQRIGHLNNLLKQGQVNQDLFWV